MIYVIQYKQGDGGNSRYFYPANETYLSLWKHLTGDTPYNRVPEYDIERIKYLAEAHDWRIIEV